MIEIHPWGATARRPDETDRVIFDLDPGEGVGWPELAEAARRVRVRMLDRGLPSLLKTSGGRGLHVVVPLDPPLNWAAAAALGDAVAAEMAGSEPDFYTVAIEKAAREGRIFIDVLRNRRGASAVAPWSIRARPGAPVSMPLTWEALDETGALPVLTVRDLAGSGIPDDPWRASFPVRQYSEETKRTPPQRDRRG